MLIFIEDTRAYAPLFPIKPPSNTPPHAHQHFFEQARLFLQSLKITRSIKVNKMKVILVGATDFVGREVLNQCIRNPDISHITVISRTRILNEFGGKRLKTLLLDNYNSYDELIRDLKGSGIRYDACLW